MIRRACISFCVGLLLPGTAWAGTVYVNNVIGDDRANGLAPDIRTEVVGPVATVGRALELAHGSDVISIANTGIAYSESVILDRPELAGRDPGLVIGPGHLYRRRPYKLGADRIGMHPFVIDGNGAVVRGSRPLASSVWSRVGEGTYRYEPYRKAHYQLIVSGTPAVEVPADSAAAAPPALQPLQWCAWRGFVYFRVEPGRFIDQYEIEAPLFEIGLGLHNARNVLVRNLNIEHFRLDGIHVSGSSRNIRLESVRSTGNGRAGLTAAGTSQVQAGRLDLAGNRIAERLVQPPARVVDLPDAAVPPPPAAATWDPESGRFVRIRLDEVAEGPVATARRGNPEARKR
jgi:hypothetical protein